jgi:hypothetical protein
MARTKMNQRSANRVDVPVSATGGPTPPSMTTYAVLAVSVLAAIWAAAMLTPGGKTAYVYFFAYCEFYMGVLALVSLSITIMLGLVATDRLVLSIRQRVLLQSAHRTTGLIAVGALFVHLWTKSAENHIRLLDIFVPFLAPYNTLFIGMGQLSAYVMVLVMWSGLARARFIGRGKPWMWRGIHAVSYLIWPLALLHGLNAGRPAAAWVIVSYIICVLLVLIGLAVRLSVSLNRNKDFASQAGTANGGMQPVGKLVPTSAQPSKGRSKSRRDSAAPDASVAAVEPWTPASPRIPAPVEEPVRPAPEALEPVAERRPRRGADDDERARRRRDFDDAPTQRWEFEDDDMPAPRSRRHADDDAPAPRQRRAVEDDRFDEATRAMPARRYADEDELSTTGTRRRLEDGYADAPPPARSRRYAGTEFEEPPAPRARGRRYEDEDELSTTGTRHRLDDDAPRSRRYADEDEPPAPRQRRYAEEEQYDETPRRRSRYADDEPPRAARAARYEEEAEIPVDIASRRGRRAAPQEPAATASRGARRGRGRGVEETADDDFLRQLRGEAQ